MKCRSISDLLKLDANSCAISKLNIDEDESGDTPAVILLTKLLNSYLEFRNAKSFITPDSMRELVYIMLEDYSHLTVEDFAFFFRKCKKGEYGTDYNQVNGTVLLQWLAQFDSDLDNSFLDMKIEEHQRIKEDMDAGMDAIFEAPPEDVQRHLNELIHGISCTDADLPERKNARKQAQEIRQRVINENLKLYSTMPNEADEKIDELIKAELISNNLFEFL